MHPTLCVEMEGDQGNGDLRVSVVNPPNQPYGAGAAGCGGWISVAQGGRAASFW